MKLWIPDRIWDQQACWIIGGGPSILDILKVPAETQEQVLKKEVHPSILSGYFGVIRDEHVIGINNVYQIGSWIDIVFFGDCSWYNVHRNALARFSGLKVSCCRRFEGWKDSDNREMLYMKKDGDIRQGITTKQGHVSWNSNSGLAAISMAVQLGVKRIFLLGFDMCARERYSHWHGHHDHVGRVRRRLNYTALINRTARVASDAERLGLEILNVNPKSAIPYFPKITLEEALEWND